MVALVRRLHCREVPIQTENPMKNPWTKKNPFMSIWLSNANRVAGAARGRMAAEGKRAASTAMTEGARQMMAVWTDALTPTKPARKRKRR